MFIYKSVTIRAVIKARRYWMQPNGCYMRHSRLLQLRTHADGLEQNVHDMHKEIEKLKDDVKKRDSTIKSQMTYIENLHKLISK